jgi:hypothetical protein
VEFDMLLVAQEHQPRVRGRAFRGSGRVLILLCIASFLSINLANPILVGRREAADWASSEFGPKAGRLPTLPRQSWSPSAEDRAQAAIRKGDSPPLPRPPSSIASLANLGRAMGPCPAAKYPPALGLLTLPSYLQPYLEGSPFTSRPPPA